MSEIKLKLQVSLHQKRKKLIRKIILTYIIWIHKLRKNKVKGTKNIFWETILDQGRTTTWIYKLRGNQHRCGGLAGTYTVYLYPDLIYVILAQGKGISVKELFTLQCNNNCTSVKILCDFFPGTTQHKGSKKLLTDTYNYVWEAKLHSFGKNLLIWWWCRAWEVELDTLIKTITLYVYSMTTAAGQWFLCKNWWGRNRSFWSRK